VVFWKETTTMKRASAAALCAIGLFVSAACGGDRQEARDARQSADDVSVTETGCLSARGDRFVLTDLEGANGISATEAFQLIGNEEELRRHVGKQVRVSGQAEPAQVAVVRESTPPAADQQPPAGTSGSAEPSVTAETQTRVEFRKLTVSSFEPTGASCAEEIRR
jgi:hypothetical protein